MCLLLSVLGIVVALGYYVLIDSIKVILNSI